MAVAVGHELVSSGLNENNLCLQKLNETGLRFHKALMYICLEQPIVTAAASTFT